MRRMRMRSALVVVAITGLAGGVAVGTVVHYVHEVRVARRETAALVARATSRFGGRPAARDLSAERTKMLLAVEDPTFHCHHGVDLETPGAGMTTLTQGLVKLIYFPDGFHPGIAKIRQTLIAQYALDEQLPKNDQLALFLDICYLGTVDGREVHGFADAAQTYFGKPLAALTDDEFLSLVAMLIRPNALRPGTTANAARVERIRQFLSGELKPASVLDTDYVGKTHGTLSEEALMALLRFVTDARPRCT
jgi:membrane carboxypeptidase/penicillin-binding protein PbpC